MIPSITHKCRQPNASPQQSRKKQKLSGQQHFCRKNFPDKARKSRQFSNSRQMRIKGGFARFCASAWSKYAPQAVLTINVPNLGHLGLSENLPDHPSTFLDHPDSFQIIRTHFLNKMDTLRIMWKLSRLSRYISRSSRLFLEYPDIFFRLSGHFLHHMEAFQFIPTLFRSSRNFPVHPDTLHISWIFCIVSGYFPK